MALLAQTSEGGARRVGEPAGSRDDIAECHTIAALQHCLHLRRLRLLRSNQCSRGERSRMESAAKEKLRLDFLPASERSRLHGARY
jgi:hypothetical protein